MPIYEVTVTRSGVPYETWEADTTDLASAIAACRAERTDNGTHDATTDTYRAAKPNAVSDNLALLFASLDLARHFPTLYADTTSTL